CQMVLGVLVSVAFAVITMSVMLAILISRSVGLTLIALLVVPPLAWANVCFGRKFKEKTEAAKEADSAYVSSIHRAVAAIGLTQAFGREEDEFLRFGSAARRCISAWVGINREEIGYGLSIGTILGIGGALIMGYGGYLVHLQSLSPGELTVFMSYLAMMYDPLCQLTLSGGQKQRLAVARALLTEAPILVLDEPTSAQDAHHEDHLRDTLRLLKGKRTMVVVSHRITTIQDCDLICLLEAGRIKEMGTHQELMQRKGAYYKLAWSSSGGLTAAA
ncbi:MAG: ABC transporter transmembrane domain-containing protein, partial [Candidatus Binatia bacterium]